MLQPSRTPAHHTAHAALGTVHQSGAIESRTQGLQAMHWMSSTSGKPIDYKDALRYEYVIPGE